MGSGGRRRAMHEGGGGGGGVIRRVHICHPVLIATQLTPSHRVPIKRSSHDKSVLDVNYTRRPLSTVSYYE